MNHCQDSLSLLKAVCFLDNSHYCALILLCSLAPSGRPQNFIVSTTSRTLTLTWSPPLPSQRNGVIINYLVTCTVGGMTSSNRMSGTSRVVAIDPFTSYTCSVLAATMVGDGPPATSNGTSDEDGEYIIYNSYRFYLRCVVQFLQDHLVSSLVYLKAQVQLLLVGVLQQCQME